MKVMRASSMCLSESSGKELRLTRYSAASLRAVTSATGEALDRYQSALQGFVGLEKALDHVPQDVIW